MPASLADINPNYKYIIKRTLHYMYGGRPHYFARNGDTFNVEKAHEYPGTSKTLRRHVRQMGPFDDFELIQAGPIFGIDYSLLWE